MKVNISDPVEHFVAFNIDFLNRMLNGVTTSDLAVYLECNQRAKEYYHQLEGALSAANSDENEVPFAKKSEIKGLVIDVKLLLRLLDSPQSGAGQDLINCLWVGLEDWHLQMISAIYKQSFSTNRAPLQALTWLEKNRKFIKKCINKDPSLYQWLECESNSDSKASLGKFTTALHALFAQTVELEEYNVGYRVPRLMDVRTLWYSIYAQLAVRYAHYYNVNLLLTLNFDDIIKKNLAAHYGAAIPSVAGCFLDAINGLDPELRHRNLPLAGNDVLMWLLVMHPDNHALSELVVKHAPQLDDVIQQYHHGKKHLYRDSQMVMQFNLFQKLDPSLPDPIIEAHFKENHFHEQPVRN